MKVSVKQIWRFTRYIVLGLLMFVMYLLINTWLFKSRQQDVAVVAAAVLEENALSHLQQLIRYETVSYDDPSRLDSSQFLQMRRFLESAYPLTHAALTREIINGYSLLYRWEGMDTTLGAAVFIAHMDVVPVDDGTRSRWTHPPFEGKIADGFVWGRGAIDNKANIASIFESIEKLLAAKQKPRRSIYLVLGHDEENGGMNGARSIAERLMSRRVKADFIFDEGGFITSTRIPGLQQSTALLGTSEKGFLSLELIARADGGHSSMPANETAIDILSAALKRVHETGFEPRVTPAVRDFIDHLGPELPFVQKMVFANASVFAPLIINKYEQSPAGSATMKTTVVPTIISGGIKENVVPETARAVLNLRLLPGDSISIAMAKVREMIDDERISINKLNGIDATGGSRPTDIGYQLVERTVKKTFANTIVTPFLLIGGTDSKHFHDLSENVIRFSPVIEAEGFHGVNERISLESYRLSLWYYEQLLREL